MQMSRQASSMAYFMVFIALLPVVTSHVTNGVPKDLERTVQQSEDIAWKASGQAGLARAGTSKLRAKINKIGAEKTAAEAKQIVKVSTEIYVPQAANAEATAQASLTQALTYEAQVKQMLKTVEEDSYKNAKVAAQKEVAKLESESKKYYQSLLAKFKASAQTGQPSAAQSAAEAAKPYMDVQLRVNALVKYYNEKAAASIMQAQQSATQAKSIALTAQQEQASGNAEMAQRHMMQAHMMVAAANMKNEEALKIRKLAEQLNGSIPSYQQAAQQAAAHALSTFAGLQKEVGRQREKVHKEMQQQLEDSMSQFFDKASTAVHSTIDETSKLLDAMADETSKLFDAM